MVDFLSGEAERFELIDVMIPLLCFRKTYACLDCSVCAQLLIKCQGFMKFYMNSRYSKLRPLNSEATEN